MRFRYTKEQVMLAVEILWVRPTDSGISQAKLMKLLINVYDPPITDPAFIPTPQEIALKIIADQLCMFASSKSEALNETFEQNYLCRSAERTEEQQELETMADEYNRACEGYDADVMRGRPSGCPRSPDEWRKSAEFAHNMSLSFMPRLREIGYNRSELIRMAGYRRKRTTESRQ